ncbi:MAG: 2Fe-2S iron-sulfur cluster-binding protein, partial [Desulfotignum sp.]
MKPSCTIIFEPFGRRVTVPAGTTLFQAALSRGILLRSDCGEKGTCGKCRVVVSHPEQLSPRTRQEQKLLKKKTPEHRLSCQARVLKGPLQVSVPENLVLGNEVFGKTGVKGPFSVNPAVHRFPLAAADIKAAAGKDILSQSEKICRAVKAKFSRKIRFSARLPLAQLSNPDTYDKDLTVVFQEDSAVTAVYKGLHPN